jgi:hypothetical protein
MDAALLKDLFFGFAQLALTVGTVIYMSGKNRGNSDSNEKNSANRDTEKLLRLSHIEQSLKNLDEKYQYLSLQMAQTNIILNGAHGNNGVKGELKDLTKMVTSIDKRLAVQEAHEE